jgi:Domain of unknown function (DUF4389)
MESSGQQAGGSVYPVQFSVEYPDRDLNRLTTAFRVFVAIPILIVAATIGGGDGSYGAGDHGWTIAGATSGVYLALMNDRYPSTDEQQSVALDFPYPDAKHGLNRWLPLVKWLLAIPHYIVLVFLWLAALVSIIIAWFAILFTGRYPRGLFDFLQGVGRWTNRVIAYAFLLVTDQYPPFQLNP